MGTFTGEPFTPKMKLKISSEFHKAPGPRYRSEGNHSGEEFRTTILCPRVREALDKKVQLLIDLDGTYGFGTSFLEEAFGGLIRNDKFSLWELNSVLSFVSEEEPDLIDEVMTYMKEADSEARS